MNFEKNVRMNLDISKCMDMCVFSVDL